MENAGSMVENPERLPPEVAVKAATAFKKQKAQGKEKKRLYGEPYALTQMGKNDKALKAAKAKRDNRRRLLEEAEDEVCRARARREKHYQDYKAK